MALIKNPSEITPKTTVSMLIYGQPGIGKTTLGCSAKDAVLFDYDGGVGRINVAHMIPTVQIENWEQTYAALEELDKDFPQCKTIVIDTVGKMLDYMSVSIMEADYKMKQKDGTLSLKGYGVRKQKFIEFIKTLAVKGKNVIFIAHEKEERRGDDTMKRPEVGGSSVNDLLKELDLVGYMQARGAKRTITFNPTDEYYAKNACYIADAEIPVVADATGAKAKANTFVEDHIFAAYRAQVQNKVRLNREYHELLEEIATAVGNVENIDELNDCITVLSEKPVIFDSKIKAGGMLNEKAKALGATFDKKTKTYVAA